MEPENQFGTAASRRWQLRWGHILLALFFIILATIAYIVIHQIRTADNASQASLNGSHANQTQHNTSSNKTPVATTPKQNSTPSPKPNPVPSPSPTPSSSSSKSSSASNSSALANTGPGDTIALFVGTTLVAASLHQIYSKRRLSLTK